MAPQTAHSRCPTGSTLTSTGNLYVQGSIRIRAIVNNSNMFLAADTTLTGGGTVTMNGTVLYQNVASLTLHNVDNTIQGSGLRSETTA